MKTPIDILLDGVTWQPIDPQKVSGLTDDGIPYATHSGVCDLFGHPMRCYRLSTGQAVFHADDFEEFFTEFLSVPEEKP